MHAPALTCLLITLAAHAAAPSQPPVPVPWRDIPDPTDDAVRHVAVKAAHRGPVRLYTGLLNTWHPDIDIDMIRRLKPRHWRYDMWVHWYPRSITARPRPTWGDRRDAPVHWARYLETMLALRETGMTWQMIFHHKGPWFDRMGVQAHELDAFYQHVHLLASYARHMGLPFDYWEICNEPGTGPYSGVKGYTFQGTWPEFLDHWDTAYRAIRDAHPEAKIVGPSHGECTPATMEPFLDHCLERGQILNVLSWHEGSQEDFVFGPDYTGPPVLMPDRMHHKIELIRERVERKYGKLGIEEIHIDEWGHQMHLCGPGTQIAFFHYFDQAGIDRAARAHWTADDLDALLIDPKTPRSTYWCWVAYAEQDGGLRLATDTDDRNVVALASRHDGERTVRAVIARAKRDTGHDHGRSRPPVTTVLDLEGIPLTDAEVTVLRLGPDQGVLREADLDARTARTTRKIDAGSLKLTIDRLEEDQVCSITIAPIGTHRAASIRMERAAAHRAAAQGVLNSRPLPHLLFREGFEEGFVHGRTVLGQRGWTHAKHASSHLTAFRNDGARSGRWYAQFVDNYWSDHDVMQPIDVKHEGVLEATAWFRFPDYEGNEHGRGLGAMAIGLHETADADVDRNYIMFKFGTNEQNGYSVVIFNNDGARRVHVTRPSRLRHDVRTRWHQIGVVLDFTTRTLRCRHRGGADEAWLEFDRAKLARIDWTPRFLRISAYNQAPDWHFLVDDIELRASVEGN